MSQHPGVLAIWHDIEQGHRAEVLQWYDHEHHTERVRVPGFVRARRHSALSGEPELFIYYETESPEVLGSPDYLGRVDSPTEWTRRTMRHFRGNVRSACRVTHRSCGPDGAYAGTVRLRPLPGREAELRNHLVQTVFPELHDRRAVLSTQLWESDPGLTMIHSTERDLRTVPDQTADWVVVVSTSDAGSVGVQLDGPLSSPALERAGAAPNALVGQYRLDFALERDHLGGSTAPASAHSSH
ncbi:hypothetical protein [Actinacidiphila sp. ITFR-21]|uniref:hypothetical protein n=1 Tax=Actinacidiphila sp. ITFR-21 TaxID=3075199 RepID=UPI00288AFFE9|nr:hypothetical protein [Streptomyces sp. ITFR-21]WNI18733.1 hypothetical protein RLT57_26550 [Streptomyces sp. ITFR-21]